MSETDQADNIVVSTKSQEVSNSEREAKITDKAVNDSRALNDS